jgi:hypothetical protein
VAALIKIISLIGFFILLWILVGILYFFETCGPNHL